MRRNVEHAERHGGFNEGTVPGVNWLIAPGGPATEFEFRISLAAAYTGGTLVFEMGPEPKK